MASEVKGPVGPSNRRARARATRLRIIRAAHRLFVERGYAGTRMADVAEDAGVAVQSVYFTFHTKVELLQACYELAVLGEDDPRPPSEQPWYRAILEADSGPEALGHFARGYGEIAARVAVLDDVVRAASHEPEAVQVRAHSEALRRDGYRFIVATVADRFGLRAGLEAEEATDVLLVLGGSAIYRQLVVDYGWPHDAFVAWLTASLGALLLAEPGT